jgi:hypothetical protein
VLLAFFAGIGSTARLLADGLVPFHQFTVEKEKRLLRVAVLVVGVAIGAIGTLAAGDGAEERA